jgi:hypothetical protein
MYRLSQKAGVKMDLFRGDGDKGMAGLPHQHGCAKHKFETFRRPRKISGIQQTAHVPGRAPTKGNHPGLSIREMTEGPKIFHLELMRKHGHKSNQAAFKGELHRSLPQIDLVQSALLVKEPLGELTKNTHVVIHALLASKVQFNLFNSHKHQSANLTFLTPASTKFGTLPRAPIRFHWRTHRASQSHAHLLA